MSFKRIIWALVFIAAGTLIILNMYGIVSLPSFHSITKFILPAILILIGIGILFPSRHHERLEGKFEDMNPGQDCSVMFAGRNIDYKDREFDGISIKAAFGGVKLHLDHADIKDGAVINAETLFGGIDITLPDDVKVEVHSNSFAGGVNDDRHNKKDGAKTLVINASCIFGGINIR